jgi:phenylalanyl-tRNA synthetase alpha chain
MKELLEKLLSEIPSLRANNADEAEQLRIKYLGKKGAITQLFEDFRNISADEKKLWGKPLNELKTLAQQKIEELKNSFNNTTSFSKQGNIDLSRPSDVLLNGAMHPLTLVENKINEIFMRIGFSVADGPEIEDDWHNFTALNFPENHPARDMQDTFFIKQSSPSLSLRTHTSSVQVRVMETEEPPIRMIMPGRVYRNEAVSARAHCFFHQVEGLYIDKDVTFADLKQTLQYFALEMFGNKTKIRLRPSYFPFTEISAEADVSCMFCKGKGCHICKHSGWVEILGCGMVDPAVLENCNINNNEYSGYAFGMGIERIAMLLYEINDLRLFSENDMRFLKQFASET